MMDREYFCGTAAQVADREYALAIARASAAPEIDTRWSLEHCGDIRGNPLQGDRALKLWGVPMDYSGMQKTRDLVPYKAKTLEAKTKHLLSGSPEFAPRTKSVARYADQNLRQRFPTGGPQRTRQSPCMPWESGPNCLPGMEAFMNAQARANLEASK